jgi:hypothetical protein
MAGKDATRSCVAWAKTKEGEVVESPEINMAMAKAEGWSTKSGSKWLTMPELMLRYRAAAFFARIYAPDITLGMHTSEEIADIVEIRDVTPKAHALPAENPFKRPVPLPEPEPEPETPAEEAMEAEVAK